MLLLVTRAGVRLSSTGYKSRQAQNLVVEVVSCTTSGVLLRIRKMKEWSQVVEVEDSPGASTCNTWVLRRTYPKDKVE
jgi:hypothetical protein